MIDMGWKLTAEAKQLLEIERVVPAVPATVRARAVARARSSIAASTVVAAEAWAPPRRFRFAFAGAMGVSATMALGAAAYAWVSHRSASEKAPGAAVTGALQTSVPSSGRPGIASSLVAGAETLAAPEGDESGAASGRGPRSAKPVSRDEVILLQRARAAVARKDFAGALRPLAIHARKFKDGSLAEEREALHVKALAGLGRLDEARRSAAAFAQAFPRSALLPVVQQLAP